MAYQCELGNGHYLYLDNPGMQTIVTLSSSRAGQQQQSSQNLQTGAWTAAPEVFYTTSGVAVVKLHTDQGELFVQTQGSSISRLNRQPDFSNAQQMQVQLSSHSSALPPIAPMPPMTPMKMGDMQMSLNPMTMRMGNMAMQIETPASISPTTRRFCSQCGTSTQLGDRFCSNCGHQLI